MLGEPVIWICHVYSFEDAASPYTLTAKCTTGGKLLGNAARQKVSKQIAGALLLFDDYRSQPSANMGIKPLKDMRAPFGTYTEISFPSFQILIHFFNTRF
jgi:hypothetical protein